MEETLKMEEFVYSAWKLHALLMKCPINSARFLRRRPPRLLGPHSEAHRLLQTFLKLDKQK